MRLDYYFSVNSPWSFLGSARLEALVNAHLPQLAVTVLDMGVVFPATGGFALPQRSKQRQAYRLAELRRWRDRLGIPIVLQPRTFPSKEVPAAWMAILLRDRPRDALRLATALGHALWCEERDLGDPSVLAQAADRAGLDGGALLARAQAEGETLEEHREADSRAAVAAGIFAVPTYVVDGEIFWGQDRLDFVAESLAGRSPA